MKNNSEIVNYNVQYGPHSVVTADGIESSDFISEFSSAEGDSFLDETHSNLFDNLRANMQKRKTARAVRKSDKNKRKNLRVTSKAGLRTAKATEKVMGAKTNNLAVRQSGVETATDKAIAQSIANETPAEKKPMSTGVKVAIGVGALVVVGAIVLVVVKMKAKKG